MQTTVEDDPYEEYDLLYKRYEIAIKEKDERQRELQRLRDSRRIKEEAFSDGKSAAKKGAQGFQTYHLLIVAVLFLLIGAMVGKYQKQMGLGAIGGMTKMH